MVHSPKPQNLINEVKHSSMNDNKDQEEPWDELGEELNLIIAILSTVWGKGKGDRMTTKEMKEEERDSDRRKRR